MDLVNLQASLQIGLDWYREIKKETISLLKATLPDWDLDFFDLLVIYTVVLILIHRIYLNVFKKGLNEESNFFKRLYVKFFQALIKFGPISKYIEHKTGELLLEFDKDMQKHTNKKTFKIPENGMTTEKLQERLVEWTQRDSQFSDCGKLSGSVYIPHDKKYEAQIQDFTKHFIYHNPLHFDTWPAIRQMEAEVIRMTADLFGQDKEGIGAVTSGGTESIVLSVLAHRNWAKDTKGITEPNLVLPETAHPAFIRACQYFCIEYRIAPVNPKTNRADPKQLAKLIDSNTIMTVASVPSFPCGTIDPVEDIAALAYRKKIGCHVDCCLGGFVVAFLKDKLDKFDFSVQGVTAISCDHHKYGLAPKGASVIMYKTKKLRQYQYFSYSAWSGGVYVAPTLAGSRSGAGIAGAWYAMVSNGKKKYQELANHIHETVKNISAEINKIPELEVIGNPQVSVVGFKSKTRSVDVFAIHQILTSKGWNLNTIFEPKGVHITVTHANSPKWKDYIKDIKDAIVEYKANPKKYKGGTAGAIYGTTQQIPDKRLTDLLVGKVLDYVLKI